MVLKEAFDAVPLMSDSDMAAVDEVGYRNFLRERVSEHFWAVIWPKIRGNRLRGSWWIFRMSVKMDSIKWVFEMVFGEAP